MELQQELLWKIVERELGMGLISCEPLNAGGSADVYRATVKGEPHTACIKLFRSEGAAGMARQEAEQIALLAQYSIIPFPRLYFIARCNAGGTARSAWDGIDARRIGAQQNILLEVTRQAQADERSVGGQPDPYPFCRK